MISRHWTLILRVSIAALLVSLFAGPAATAGSDAGAVFERLKQLEGSWHGDDDQKHVFRVAANGTVVMETMNPGTPHEMINMYHMDGDKLMLTHYCAGGNQPTMQLAPGESENELVFEFTGGTNLNPAVDTHIHSARLMLEDKTLESSWIAWAGGKQAHEMTFSLSRAE